MTTLADYQNEQDQGTKEFPIHPAGSHIARLADAWILPTRPGQPNKDGKSKPYTPIQSILVTKKKDENGNAIWVWYQVGSGIYISQRGKSKMYQFYEALLGQTLGEKEALAVNLEDVIGKYVRLAITHLPHTDDPKKMSAQVTSVSALSEDDDGHPEISLKGYVRPKGKKVNYWTCQPKWEDNSEMDLGDTP